MPRAVARLNSDGGSPSGSSACWARSAAATARLSVSASSSSTMCRGAFPSRFSWTVTPHVAWIGRQVPDGSTSGGVHGPAATSTASAAIVHPSERTTPVARPSRSIGLAAEPTTMTAPRSWASAAHAAVAAEGGTGKPVASRTAAGPGAREGSRRWSSSGSIRSGRSSGNASSIRTACARAPSRSGLSRSSPAGSSPIANP